jgi:acetyl-CoA carboxylase carboxyltransferase component
MVQAVIFVIILNLGRTTEEAMAVEKRIEERLEELDRLREQSHLGGGLKRIEQQHLKGKLTARERLELLLDPGTFQELDPFVTSWAADTEPGSRGYLGDAVVTGFGKINGRPTYVYAQDFTVLGGSLSEAVAEKVCKVMDMAMKNGAPIIGLNDSGGARIQEGVVSLAGYGELFLRNTMASGVVPQISVILGPCAGGAVYSHAITDFVFMVQDLGQMYITGPDVIKAATGEVVSHETLGGAQSHATTSGVAHFNFASEQECLSEVRRLLALLPQNNMDDPPFIPPFDDPPAPTTSSPTSCLMTWSRAITCERSSTASWTMAISWRCTPSSPRTSSLALLASGDSPPASSPSSLSTWPASWT